MDSQGSQRSPSKNDARAKQSRKQASSSPAQAWESLKIRAVFCFPYRCQTPRCVRSTRGGPAHGRRKKTKKIERLSLRIATKTFQTSFTIAPFPTYCRIIPILLVVAQSQVRKEHPRAYLLSSRVDGKVQGSWCRYGGFLSRPTATENPVVCYPANSSSQQLQTQDFDAY